MNGRTLGFLALAAGAGGVAFANELPDAVTDGGTITIGEVRERSAAVFDAFSDGRDRVSRDAFVGAPDLGPELGAAGSEARRVLFDLLDESDDGVLTRREWDARIRRDLEFADENDDGTVTLDELERARRNLGLGDAIEMVF